MIKAERKSHWIFGPLFVSVYGIVYNDFVSECIPSKWTFVTRDIFNRRGSGDGYAVVLIFDSINQKQEVRFADFKVEVFGGCKYG